MSVYEEVINTFKNLNNYIFDCVDKFEEELKNEIAWFDSIQNDIEEFHKTGVLQPSFVNTASQTNSEAQLEVREAHTIEDSQNSAASSSLSNSSKENAPLNTTTDLSNKRMTRQAKKSVLSNVLNLRADRTDGIINNIKVKMERVTECLNDVVKSSVPDVEVKEEMPPPKKPPAKNTRKKKVVETSLKIKSEVVDDYFKKQQEVDKNRDSDVQIQTNSLDTIVVEDSFVEQPLDSTRQTRARTKARQKNNETTDESHSETEGKKTRPTRTKRTKKVIKEVEDKDTQDQVDEIKDKNELIKTKTRSRSNIRENANSDDEEPQAKNRKLEGVNHLEVASSTPVLVNGPKLCLNETQVINQPVLLNETVVLEKATIPKEPINQNDIMTDDEDSPVRSKQPNKVKQVFSPYENSPVKKRVQAFEKLGAATEATSKATRSKVMHKPSTEKETLKMFSVQKPKETTKFLGTPTMENRLKRFQPSSASKIPTSVPTTVHTLNKAATSVKTSTSQMEFRERELRRKQKEAEALQKKEAMILAQTEEKRKKREEREMKVQQGKTALEKDKKSKLEMLAEKEAKFLKQREEAAKKRAAAVKKAAEARLNENAKAKKFVPPYLKYETPLLPSPDCYDSDDSSSNHKIRIPSWQQKSVISQTQQVMHLLKPYRNTFFLSGPRTPNLQDIFPTIEPSKLKRTSSAIWNNTEMSMIANFTEEED